MDMCDEQNDAVVNLFNSKYRIKNLRGVLFWENNNN